MKGSYLGCSYTNKEIIKYLSKINASFHTFADNDLFEKLAEYLDQGKVIGWFNGAMEFGPRVVRWEVNNRRCQK